MCVYQKCSHGDCGVRYEVCSENPLYVNITVGRHICHAVFIVDIVTGKPMADQQCFDDPHSPCNKECNPNIHEPASNDETALYDCCCTGRNLCNDVTFNFTGIQVFLSHEVKELIIHKIFNF